MRRLAVNLLDELSYKTYAFIVCLYWTGNGKSVQLCKFTAAKSTKLIRLDSSTGYSVTPFLLVHTAAN